MTDGIDASQRHSHLQLVDDLSIMPTLKANATANMLMMSIMSVFYRGILLSSHRRGRARSCSITSRPMARRPGAARLSLLVRAFGALGH